MKFDKFLDTYEKYATVQNRVAEKLIDFIPKERYGKVLEIGCGTGILSRFFLRKFKPELLVLNDYFDTRKFLNKISYNEFVKGDMDLLQFQKYDLIISSSTLQWSKDFEALIQKFSESSSNLFFSIYTKENLIEIERHFGISLKYHTFGEIEKILKKYYNSVKYEEEQIILSFDTSIKALRHLKYTGVTGFSKNTSVEKIRSFSSEKLTYKVGYFSCQ